MADYYNKTRSPVTVALHNGASLCISPKTWTFIPPSDEGTESLCEALKNGFLIRAKIPFTQAPVSTPSVAPVRAVEPISSPSVIKASTTELGATHRKGR